MCVCYSVEHIENIGIHYYKTLRCWRKNFLEHQRLVSSANSSCSTLQYNCSTWLTLVLIISDCLWISSKIHSLGFDEKFIRTWEYYFDYCAAGFKTRTLGNYQVLNICHIAFVFVPSIDMGNQLQPNPVLSTRRIRQLSTIFILYSSVQNSKWTPRLITNMANLHELLASLMTYLNKAK